MARTAMTKHVVGDKRRRSSIGSRSCASLRANAGRKSLNKPNRIRYVGRRGDTGPGASHDQRDSAASNGGLNGGPANWPVLCLVTEI